MKKKQTIEGVKAVIADYIDGTYTADEGKLRSVFHENAIMSGYLEGQEMVTTPEAFIEDVISQKSMKDTNAPYTSELLEVSITGRIATAVIKETGFFGNMCFEDHFHLIYEKEWKIVSKLFTTCEE